MPKGDRVTHAFFIIDAVLRSHHIPTNRATSVHKLCAKGFKAVYACNTGSAGIPMCRAHGVASYLLA